PPRPAGVPGGRVEAPADDAALESGVEHREAELDAPEEVARHPVGAREVNVLGAAIVEVKDARMLEEAADDRAHTNVFRQAFNARAQRAHAAHDELDLHAGARGGIE